MGEGAVGTVVIPAHNEAQVIERCLAALLSGDGSNCFEIVVACNGCTDGTADRARAFDRRVRVIEIAEASKTAALQAADTAAQHFPRLYLDADVVLSGSSAAAVLRRLGHGDVLAARPGLSYDTSACSSLVRRYYAARVLVPGLMNRLWGAGVYGLSAQGRARFGAWPRLVADDLFVDSLFRDDEIEIVEAERVVVHPPRNGRALLAVLRRVYRSKDPASEAVEGQEVVPEPRQTVAVTARGLVAVVLRRPMSLIDVAVYALFAVWGRAERLVGPDEAWERDCSSRGR